MLANGAKLGYKAGTGSTYTDLPGLKELPDLGLSPEMVDNTALADAIKHYDIGIGDASSFDFKFRYDNSSASSSYRVMRGFGSTTKSFQVELSDGTKFSFDAKCAVVINGAGVNGALEFTASLALQSDITITDPA